MELGVVAGRDLSKEMPKIEARECSTDTIVNAFLLMAKHIRDFR